MAAERMAKPIGQGFVLGVDRRRAATRGEAIMKIDVSSWSGTVRCIVMDRLVNGLQLIIGIDVIHRCGGVFFSSEGIELAAKHKEKISDEEAQLSKNASQIVAIVKNTKRRQKKKRGDQKPVIIANEVAGVDEKKGCEQEMVKILDHRGEEKIIVDDVDFTAKFDGSHWTVWWKWKHGKAPEVPDGVSNCSVSPKLEPEFTREVDEWILKGWLKKMDGEAGAQNVALTKACVQ